MITRRAMEDFVNNMQRKFNAVNQYKKDFLAKGEAPTHKWLMDNIFYDEDIMISACSKQGIFQFFSIEFIEFLAKEIKKLNPSTIIEIGAGDGMLSFFLKKYGNIDITPTDPKRREDINYPDSVEKLNHKEALEKYNPDLVLVCWEEYMDTYAVDAINYPSVNNVIWIGEYFGCCGNEHVLPEYNPEELENPYCLCRTDDERTRSSVQLFSKGD